MDDGWVNRQMDGRVDGAWVTHQPLPGDHSSFLVGSPTSILGPCTHFPHSSCRDDSKT